RTVPAASITSVEGGFPTAGFTVYLSGTKVTNQRLAAPCVARLTASLSPALMSAGMFCAASGVPPQVDRWRMISPDHGFCALGMNEPRYWAVIAFDPNVDAEYAAGVNVGTVRVETVFVMFARIFPKARTMSACDSAKKGPTAEAFDAPPVPA